MYVAWLSAVKFHNVYAQLVSVPPMMKEEFSIPAAAAIIECEINGVLHILIQERIKPASPNENGLIEIPAGKIRKFESIFDTIRREVYEETGLSITLIEGEHEFSIREGDGYKVSASRPYFVTQNLIGNYPIIILTYCCKAEGTPFLETEEARNIRWMTLSDAKHLLNAHPEKFYAMHLASLEYYFKFKKRRSTHGIR